MISTILVIYGGATTTNVIIYFLFMCIVYGWISVATKLGYSSRNKLYNNHAINWHDITLILNNTQCLHCEALLRLLESVYCIFIVV